jgi:uncharacterized protein YdhG (YjbR/CyaY superfamily)
MPKKAATVAQYLAGLPPDRRAALEQVRSVILENLPKGYQESMTWGIPSYEVPLDVLPETYNGKPLGYAALGSQKNYMSLYLMNVYGDKKTEQWFRSAFEARGKKLDMGKSCIRFKKVDDLPLDVVGEAISRTPMDAWVRMYRSSRRGRKK